MYGRLSIALLTCLFLPLGLLSIAHGADLDSLQQQNLRRIAELHQRQAAWREAPRLAPRVHLASARESARLEAVTAGVEEDAEEEAISPAETLQMTPAEIDFEEARPWMLIRKPWPRAIKVPGGWLLHRNVSAGYHGFFRSMTEADARRLMPRKPS